MRTDDELLVTARKMAFEKTMEEAHEAASIAAKEKTERFLQDMRKDYYEEQYREIFEQECEDRYADNLKKFHNMLIVQSLQHW